MSKKGRNTKKGEHVPLRSVDMADPGSRVPVRLMNLSFFSFSEEAGL